MRHEKVNAAGNPIAEKDNCLARGEKSLVQGRWGELQAKLFLMSQGWRVIGQNVRPCPRDLRCEIDLIVLSASKETVVFVEVKTHRVRSPWASRLARIDKDKKRNVLRACANWIMRNHWHGNFRFDVVEVYGWHADTRPAEIDHIENVPLFPSKWRFW